MEGMNAMTGNDFEATSPDCGDSGKALYAVFDPEVTELWTPAMEAGNPVEVTAIWPPETAGETPERADAVLPRKRRTSGLSGSDICSALLSVVNGILFFSALGAAIYLITSLFAH